MAGIFDLHKPRDLLAKLERKLNRLRTEPYNVDHAFNFFTTAEHILDWLYPGDPGKSVRRKFRNADPLLSTVSHLATGAKHFDKLSAHHKSVLSTERKGGWWPLGYWARGYWARGYWARGWWSEPHLSVTLTGAAASTVGATITALDLAEKVYAYWSRPGRVP